MLWRVDSGEPDDAPLQQHVDALLLWLNRSPTTVKALGDDYDLTLHCVCWAADTFGLHLTRDQVVLLLVQHQVILQGDAHRFAIGKPERIVCLLGVGDVQVAGKDGNGNNNLSHHIS